MTQSFVFERAVLLTALACLALVVDCIDIYASPFPVGTQTCAEDDPCSLIAALALVSGAGDRVFLNPGLYPSQDMPDDPITLLYDFEMIGLSPNDSTILQTRYLIGTPPVDPATFVLTSGVRAAFRYFSIEPAEIGSPFISALGVSAHVTFEGMFVEMQDGAFVTLGDNNLLLESSITIMDSHFVLEVERLSPFTLYNTRATVVGSLIEPRSTRIKRPVFLIDSGSFVMNETTVDGADGTNYAYVLSGSRGMTILLSASTLRNNPSCIVVDQCLSVVVTECDFISNRFLGSGTDFSSGGSISATSTPIIVADSLFDSGGASSVGGAIGSSNGDVVIRRCTFTHNTAASGGAVYAYFDVFGSITIVDSVFDHNIASTANGGAVWMRDCVVDIQTTTFTGNSALFDAGGAINAIEATMTVVDSSFSDHRSIKGGAIALTGSCDDNGDCPELTLERSSFVGNTAGTGGALLLEGYAIASVSASTFLNNQVGTNGGAFHLFENSALTLSNSFCLNSTAPYGGGCIYAALRATVDVSQCLFQYNYAYNPGSGRFDGFGGGVFMATTSSLSVVSSDFLSNIGSKGGGIFLTDSAQANVVDSHFYNNRAINDGGGFFGETRTSSNFTSSVFRANEARTGAATGIRNNAVFNMTDCIVSNHTAADEDSWIKDGGGFVCNGDGIAYFSDVVFSYNNVTQVGGALMTDTCHVTIRSCIFRRNFADVYGGAIYSNQELTLTNTIIDQNWSLYGGGVYFFHVETIFEGPIDVDYNTISNNRAEGSGGAFFFDDVLPVWMYRFAGGEQEALSTGYIFCEHCELTDNWAGGYGSDVGTAGSRVQWYNPNLPESPEAQTLANQPAASTQALTSWGFRVYLLDYYNQSIVFNDGYPLAFRPMQVKVGLCEGTNGRDTDEEACPGDILRRDLMQARNDDLGIPRTARIEHTDGIVIGPTLVTVTDGSAVSSGLLLRGERVTSTYEGISIPMIYTILFTTVPTSALLTFAMELEQCEPGYYFKSNPDNYFECIRCAAGTYDLSGSLVYDQSQSDDPTYTPCYPCPEGALCDGEDNMKIQRDFWWDPQSEVLGPDNLPLFYRCIPTICCQGDSCPKSNDPLVADSDTRCAENRDLDSFLCSKCNETGGFYEWNYKCIDCSKYNINLLLVPVVVLVVFLIFVTYMGSSLAAEFRIAINFGQVLALVVGPVISSHPDLITWLNIFHMRVDVMAFWGTPDMCPYPFSPLGKLLMRWFIPTVGLVLVCFGSFIFFIFVVRWTLRRKAKGLSTKRFKSSQLIDAFINLFIFAEIPVTEAAFQFLFCRQIQVPATEEDIKDDPTLELGWKAPRLVLRDAPDIACFDWSSGHVPWLGVSLALLFLYTTLLPGIVFARRYRSNLLLSRALFWHKEESKVMKKIYRQEVFWWELVVIYRAVTIVLLYVLFFDKPGSRTPAIAVICIVSGAVHVLIMPYKNQVDNVMESLSWILLCYISYLISYGERKVVEADMLFIDDRLRVSTIGLGLASMLVYILVFMIVRPIQRFLVPFKGVDSRAMEVRND